MRNGLGSPYVKIFTSLGEVTSKVVDFVYKYSQEADDTCQIRIEDTDVNLADRAEFQEGVILTVIWGYLGETITAKRKVQIKNIKPSFTATVISLDLLCTDKSSGTKSTSSKKIHSGTLEDIAKEIADKNGLALGDMRAHIDEHRPGYYSDDGNYTTQIDNVANVKDIHFRTYDQLPQANRSDYAVLKEAANNDPNGPFEIYGRDETLNIVKKNVNQKPQKVYNYADKAGLVIAFYPEEKPHTRKQTASHVNTTAFNPKKKTAYDINTNEFTNDMAKLGDVTEMPPRVADSGISDANNNPTPAKVDTGDYDHGAVMELLERSNKKLGIPNSTDPLNKNKLIKPTGGKPTNSDVSVTDDYKKAEADTFQGNYALKQDFGLINFSIYNTESPAFLNNLNETFTAPVSTTAVVKNVKNVPTDYNRHIPSSEHTVEEAYAKAKGVQANSALKANPAELTVVGDPILESGKVIRMLNVSKKHSGNYYADECEHKISKSSPYLVTFKLSKNAMGKTTKEGPTKVSVSAIDNPKLKTTVINKESKPEKNADTGGKTLIERLAHYANEPSK